MKRRFLLAAMTTLVLHAWPAFAAEAVQTESANLFQSPLVLRGTLGAEQVQMRLRPKAVAEEGVEGEYFVFGRTGNILLAGEPDGANLYMEESENGKDVSGLWNAKVEGDTLSGEWTAVDGGAAKRFVLKIMQPATKTPRALQGAGKPATSPTQ